MRAEKAAVFSTVDVSKPEFLRTSNQFTLVQKDDIHKVNHRANLLQTEVNLDTIGAAYRDTMTNLDHDDQSSGVKIVNNARISRTAGAKRTRINNMET